MSLRDWFLGRRIKAQSDRPHRPQQRPSPKETHTPSPPGHDESASRRDDQPGPSLDDIAKHHEDLKASIKEGEILNEQLEYFNSLMETGPRLDPTQLTTFLIASCRGGGSCTGMITAANQLIEADTPPNPELAAAVAEQMKRMSAGDEIHDECYATMIKLLKSNSSGSLLATHLVAVYDHLCMGTPIRYQPLAEEMQQLKEDSVAAIMETMEKGRCKREYLERLLIDLDPEKGLDLKIRRLADSAEDGSEKALRELTALDDPRAVAAVQKLKPQLDRLKAIENEVQTLLDECRAKSQSNLESVKTLIDRWAHCRSRSEKPLIEEQLDRAENVPALVALTLDLDYGGFNSEFAATALGRICPTDPCAARGLALALIDSRFGGKGHAMAALINLGSAAAPAMPYLKQILEYDVDAALCIAQIGVPDTDLPKVLESLAWHVEHGGYQLDTLSQYYGKTKSQMAFDLLLNLGEPARAVLMALVQQQKLRKEWAEQVLERFGEEDRVAILIAALKFADETEQLRAAEELENLDDPRASQALADSAEKLAKIRLCQQIEFETSPESLEDMRDRLLKGIKNLPVQSKDDFAAKWRPRPVAETGDSASTVKWLIDQIPKEARMIRASVADIKGTDVRCDYGRGELDGLSLPLFRRFKNGNVDVVPHVVIRVADDEYVVGHLPA